MSELSSSPARGVGDWVERLPSPLRVILLLLTIVATVFAVGVVVGIAIAALDRGVLKPRAILALVAAVMAIFLCGRLGWRLLSQWRGRGRSEYERRYNRTMLILLVAGLPVGALIGMAGDGEARASLFSNGPLDPTLAAIAAAALVVCLAGTLVLYHRAIDDHEQQAYLWANSLAFYFLTLALPAAWLLARGGLIGPIGIGTAMLLLLAACTVNFTVWAWLKYR